MIGKFGTIFIGRDALMIKLWALQGFEHAITALSFSLCWRGKILEDPTQFKNFMQKCDPGAEIFEESLM